MNGNRPARFAKTVICILAPLIIGVRQSGAQSQPATIPTVVAQAMTFEPISMFGPPRFFDGRTPADWPAELTPPAAKVLGGGILGDSAMFRIRVAVFEFPAQANAHAVIEDMIVRAGYTHPASEPPPSRPGGFADTPAPAAASDKYCKGSTLATFGVVDSVRAPTAFEVFLLDGEAGRQNCSRQGSGAVSRFPTTVPPLTPPAGAMSFAGGSSSWSGSSGDMRSTLRTTMPTDSLLAHYSAQLVAGGWKTQGRPANADGVGVQRFSFNEGQTPWTGTLIIIALGERRELMLQLSQSQ